MQIISYISWVINIRQWIFICSDFPPITTKILHLSYKTDLVFRDLLRKENCYFNADFSRTDLDIWGKSRDGKHILNYTNNNESLAFMRQLNIK